MARTDDDVNDFEQRLRRGLQLEQVPEHMHDGYVMYFLHRISPGSFGRAVLENNLKLAAAAADHINQAALFQHVSFLYNYAPLGSWGSEEAVDAWLNGENDPQDEADVVGSLTTDKE